MFKGATAEKTIPVTVGKKVIEFDTGCFSIKMVKKIQKVVADAKSIESEFRKYPMNPGESLSDYTQRISEKLEEEGIKRRKDETGDAGLEKHLERVLGPKMDAHALGLELVNRLNKLINGADKDEVTAEEYEDAHWPTFRDGMNELFLEAGLRMPEFQVKR